MASEKSYFDLIRKQKASEEGMVKAVTELEKKVNSAAAKLLLAELRLDSTKHAAICQEILDVLQKTKPKLLWDARIEGYADTQLVRKELERHLNLEKAMLQDVERLMQETNDEALKVLLTHILEDEKKHHKNIKLVVDKAYSITP